MAGWYSDIIRDATACLPGEIDEIEDLMRGVVFHSTLDWQTREQLEEGARMAYAVLREMRRNKK